MRLSEENVKRGILHPEQSVRDAAVHCFADALSPDPSIMPVAVQAIQTYGWADAFEFVSQLADLAQTEDTFLWFVEELEKAGRPRTESEGNHCLRLSSLIAKSDVGHLLRHKAAVVELAGFYAEMRKVVDDRLHLLTLDTDACWGELERLCEAGKNKQYVNEFDLGHANRLVEAIGRDDGCADRVLSLLSQKIDGYENNPMKWMEGLAVRLAGEMRLKAAIPLIVAKLHEDGEWVNEECARALTRIGDDSVTEAICNDFPTAPWHFRLYAGGTLENLRSDLVVSKCLELYKQEEDGQIQENLLRATLSNFSSDGIEPARQWTVMRGNSLRRSLVATATLMEMDFPELRQWQQEEKQRAEDRKRRQEEMLSWFAPPKPKVPLPSSLATPSPQRPMKVSKKVGRNDPCPCGSGKKYKKCCMTDE